MPTVNSFDIVSRVNLQEVDNAIHQTMKEINQRFDFKGTNTTVERNNDEVTIITTDDFKLKNASEIFCLRLVKRGVSLKADSDNVIGLSEPGTYDNELLDVHFIAGDGRVNENIGLTSVHHIFHSEHNRLVEYDKKVILDTGDLVFLNQWLMPGTELLTFPDTPSKIALLSWNGERLFQVAKFGT